MFRKRRSFLQILLFSAGCLGCVYMAAFTPLGIRLITTLILNIRTHGYVGEVRLPQIEGNLFQGITYRHAQIRPVSPFVTAMKIVIPECRLSIHGRGGRGLRVEVRDARVELPLGEPLHVNGRLRDGRWDVQLEGSSLNLEVLPLIFPRLTRLADLKGRLEADLHLTGEFPEPHFSGRFRMESASYQGISLQTEGTVGLSIRPEQKWASLRGDIVLSQARGASPWGEFVFPEGGIHFPRGGLSPEMEVKDLEAEVPAEAHASKVPPGTTMQVQRAALSFGERGLLDGRVEVENGRLRFPDSDPLLFWGTWAQAQLDAQVSCQTLGLAELVNRWSSAGIPRVSGVLRKVDLSIKGSLPWPQISGRFIIGQLSARGFSLSQAPAEVKIYPDPLALSPWGGRLFLSSGEVVARGTRVHLRPSTLTFVNGGRNPDLNLKGEAKVGDVKIDIAILGSRSNPSLMLTSVPSLPQETLLLMLATGKQWSSSADLFSAQAVAPDVASSFVDYFIFGGAGGRLAEKFGIRSISVTYDRDQKGIEVKKALLDDLEVEYGVEEKIQGSTQDKRPTVVHKIGGEYQVTDQVSVGVEKEVRAREKTDTVGTAPLEPPTDDKVFIKYQTNF